MSIHQAQGLVVPLLLLAASTLAGCTDGPESGTKDLDEDAPLVEVRPGLFVLSSRGVLEGVVHSDAHFPLQGARVSVLGTSFFAETAKDGGFLFANVTAGLHELSVILESYQPFQKTVEVTASNITTETIILLPLESVGPGYKPHSHDFWGGQTEIELMNAEVDLTQPASNRGSVYSGAYAMFYKPNSNGTDDGVYRIPIPNRESFDELVYPGTREVRVKFTWDVTDTTFTKLGLAYVPANTATRTYLPLKDSGQTWSIPVTGPMTDSGHQQFSLWTFFVYHGNAMVSSATTSRPHAMLGPVRVQIIVVKGVVEPEQAHEDYWKGVDRLVLRAADKWDTHGANPDRTYGGYSLKLDNNVLVPPGTDRMQIVFYWRYPSANVSSPTHDYVLTWRTGAQDPYATPLSEYKRVQEKNGGAGYKVYEFKVDSKDTDAYYQKKSNWAFLPSPKGMENEINFFDRPRDFAVQITVWKTPTFR